MSFESKKRIAFFLPSVVGGGAEKVFITLINQLTRMGVNIDLVLVKAHGVHLKNLPDCVRVVDLNCSRTIFSIFKLAAYLSESQPIAILSAMEHTNVVAILAQKISRSRARVIVSVHTILSVDQQNSPYFIHRFTKYWIKPFYKFAYSVVAVSEGVALDLIKLINLSPSKVRVIYNPIVTADLLAKSKEATNHEWFKPGCPPVIVAVGRLTEAKDFPTLIRAFDLLRAQMLCRLIILGEGEERSNLEHLILKLNLSDNVLMPGFVDNPFSYMKEASLFVLSSRWEGFGNSLAEAMACGTPVVSTDCPCGPAEILENGRWGCLVPVGDQVALANAMHSQLSSCLPDGAAARIFKRFNEETIALDYLQVLTL